MRPVEFDELDTNAIVKHTRMYTDNDTKYLKYSSNYAAISSYLQLDDQDKELFVRYIVPQFSKLDLQNFFFMLAPLDNGGEAEKVIMYLQKLRDYADENELIYKY